MKRKSSQFALVIAAMATVGSVYGWSTTAAILAGSTAWSAKEAASVFRDISCGHWGRSRNLRCVAPCFGLRKNNNGRSNTWGLALLVFSQFGLSGGSRTALIILAVLAGVGVGVAYLALVSFFRTLFARPTVISG